MKLLSEKATAVVLFRRLVAECTTDKMARRTMHILKADLRVYTDGRLKLPAVGDSVDGVVTYWVCPDDEQNPALKGGQGMVW
jgi:hypothetical protein